MFPRFSILVLVASQVLLVRSSAQSSACPDGSPSQKRPEIRIIVDAVEFHGENSLSEAERATLTEEIKKTDFATSSVTQVDWADAIVEVAIRGAFQDKGYFKVFVQSTPHLVRAEEHELHYVLRLDIESGSQYRLGNVRFKNNQDGPSSSAKRYCASNSNWDLAICSMFSKFAGHSRQLRSCITPKATSTWFPRRKPT